MPVQELTASPMGFMQWIVVVELLLIVGFGIGWLWCCIGLRYRVKELERKVNNLGPIIDHYRDFVEDIRECLGTQCEQAGGVDPDTWPPDDVPEWPGLE